MNLIDRLAELQKLEAKATQAPWPIENIHESNSGVVIDVISIEDSIKSVADIKFLANMRNAAPELLSILGEIRPGDAEILRDFLSTLPEIQQRDDFTPLCIDDYERIADCLRRYRAMAERMEAETNE